MMDRALAKAHKNLSDLKKAMRDMGSGLYVPRPEKDNDRFVDIGFDPLEAEYRERLFFYDDDINLHICIEAKSYMRKILHINNCDLTALPQMLAVEHKIYKPFIERRLKGI